MGATELGGRTSKKKKYHMKEESERTSEITRENQNSSGFVM